mmetsp:Transcript_55060/g.131207  ORF Transcript_55060/g.131207 Transcript_55060/m.131207 type:complete len:526 (-) Transcript_55060:94-1671(-)
MATKEEKATVDSADIIRLMLQFCKENGLYRTLQTLQEESRVSLNTVDSLEGLTGDITHGRWDAVLQAVSYLALPPEVQMELYSQVVLELTEMKDVETAQHLMQNTAPLIAMKQDKPQRYFKLEHLVKKQYLDPQQVYEGVPKEKRRATLAQAVSKHVEVAPPSRLLALVGQAMKWQQQMGMIPASSKFNVFRGVAHDEKQEREECPTTVGKKIKFGAKSVPECAAFSPDGQFFATGSNDGFIEVWDYMTGMVRKDLTYQAEENFMMHDKAVIAMCFSKDSDFLASGGADGQLKVWRVASGECVRRFERAHTEAITHIVWAKDGSQVLTASMDKTARAHGMKSGKSLKEYRGHTSFVNSAVFSKDYSKVVTASSDGLVIIFDAKTSEELSRVCPPPPAHVSSAMQYSVQSAYMASSLPGQPDEDQLFVCTRTNTMMLMNLKGQVLKSFSSGKRENADFLAMVPSPKGEWLYGVAEDQTVYCFSMETGQLEQTVKLGDKAANGLTHHPSRSLVAAFCGDGMLYFLKP